MKKPFKLKAVGTCLSVFVLLTIVIYACRKEPSNELEIEEPPKEVAKQAPLISHDDIVDWYISNTPGGEIEVSGRDKGEKKKPYRMPFKLKWNNAKQARINGMSVVRVPISEKAFLLFTRFNKKAPVTAFLYSIDNEKPGEKTFTGKVTWFNFQTMELRGIQFRNNLASAPQLFEVKDPKNEIAFEEIRRYRRQRDDIPTTKVLAPYTPSQHTQVVSTANYYLAYSDFSGFWNWYWGYAGDYGTGGWNPSSEGDLGYGGIMNLLDYLGPDWYGYNPGGALSNLITECGLGTDEANFVQDPYFNQTILNHCWSYVFEQTSNYSQSEKASLTKNHIELMYDDEDYHYFIANYAPLNSGTNHVWWEDEVFLADAGEIGPIIANEWHEKVVTIADPGIFANVEAGSYTTTGYDLTNYGSYQDTDSWPTVTNVLAGYAFKKYDFRNCFLLAKEQIALKGYTISGYATNQTYNINTSSGVSSTEARKAVNYMKSALGSGIPVIVGVDYAPGHPGNPDGKTDHFIVIVGMGTDSNGKYFRFYDSATAVTWDGTSTNNKLYYNSTTGVIEGTTDAKFASETDQYRANNGKVLYTITHVRKSK